MATSAASRPLTDSSSTQEHSYNQLAVLLQCRLAVTLAALAVAVVVQPAAERLLR
jgi:hypothetical protein